MENICPYCLEVNVESSKDHIFPQFLGGKRKIVCCKKCNDFFGYSFESKTAQILQQLHVFISSWGLPLRSANPIWKNAFNSNGRTYHLAIGKTSVKPILAKPIFEYDENGEIIGGVFPTEKQAKNIAKALVDKGKAKGITIGQEPPAENIDMRGLGHVLTLGPDMKKTALKMCLALSTLLHDFDVEEVEYARWYLLKENSDASVDHVLPEYDINEQIDSNRNSLSHVIYIERGEKYFTGFVQFFGVIQMFCDLGIANKSLDKIGLYATLDPLNGNEEFKNILPINNLSMPPFLIKEDDYPFLIQGWLNKLRSEAIKRGATHPPNLQISSIDIKP